MPQRITPNKVITVTKDGECHVMITLDLNINITTNGQAEVSPSNNNNDEKKKPQEDETQWEIPDFGTFNSNMLNFGKDVTNGD